MLTSLEDGETGALHIERRFSENESFFRRKSTYYSLLSRDGSVQRRRETLIWDVGLKHGIARQTTGS